MSEERNWNVGDLVRGSSARKLIARGYTLVKRKLHYWTLDPDLNFEITALPPKHPPFYWYEGKITHNYVDASCWKGGVARAASGSIFAIDPDGNRIGNGGLLDPDGGVRWGVNPNLGLDLDKCGRVQGKDLEDLRKLVDIHPPEVPKVSLNGSFHTTAYNNDTLTLTQQDIQNLVSGKIIESGSLIIKASAEEDKKLVPTAEELLEEIAEYLRIESANCTIYNYIIPELQKKILIWKESQR